MTGIESIGWRMSVGTATKHTQGVGSCYSAGRGGRVKGSFQDGTHHTKQGGEGHSPNLVCVWICHPTRWSIGSLSRVCVLSLPFHRKWSN